MMFIKIFTYFTNAIQMKPLISISASFIWGILSLILSPCHLTSIPLIVGYISNQGKITLRRAFTISLLFGIGVFFSIGLVGIFTAISGRLIGDIGKVGNYIVAVIFFLIGLYFLGFIPLPFTGGNLRGGKGFFGSFLLGIAFGVALGPCTFAYMAPMLGVVFSIARKNFILSMMLIFAYAIGHCSVIVLSGSFTEVVEKYLNWSESSKGVIVLRKICGVLVLFGGVYLIITGGR
jgi:cytochrome c-type biogenesis protein